MKPLDFREKKGTAVCILGVCLNLLLSAGKIALGAVAGLVSVIADGFNNLSDCGSGTVALVSFYISAKPADKEHPFGHRRAESVASMIAGFFVLVLAAEVLRSAIGSVIAGASPSADLVVYIVLGVSVAVKLGMFALYRIAGKRLDSDALKAAAADSLCDSVATLAVIAGAALSPVLPAADGWAGIAVSLFIAWQGLKILIETSSKLLGQAPDPALAERVKGIVLSSDSVLGAHDLQIYGYGRGASFATIHAEMDASLPMLDAHTAVDALEMQVKRETGVALTIHIDPVDLMNREESTLKLQVRERAREVAEGLEVHDFRLIPHTNRVEFDAGVPYGCRKGDGEILAALQEIVRELGDYEPVINIERK